MFQKAASVQKYGTPVQDLIAFTVCSSGETISEVLLFSRGDFRVDGSWESAEPVANSMQAVILASAKNQRRVESSEKQTPATPTIQD